MNLGLSSGKVFNGMVAMSDSVDVHAPIIARNGNERGVAVDDSLVMRAMVGAGQNLRSKLPS